MEDELHLQLVELQSELSKLKKTIEYLESAERVIESSETVTKTLEEILPSFDKLKESVEKLLTKIEDIDFDRELKEIKSRLVSILNMTEDIQRDLRSLKELVISEFGEFKNILHEISTSIETSKKTILENLVNEKEFLQSFQNEFRMFVVDYQSDIKFFKNAFIISSVLIILFLIIILTKL